MNNDYISLCMWNEKILNKIWMNISRKQGGMATEGVSGVRSTSPPPPSPPKKTIGHGWLQVNLGVIWTDF
jgi:hypothetical protein